MLVENANYQDYGTVDLFKDWLNRGLEKFSNISRLIIEEKAFLNACLCSGAWAAPHGFWCLTIVQK